MDKLFWGKRRPLLLYLLSLSALSLFIEYRLFFKAASRSLGNINDRMEVVISTNCTQEGMETKGGSPKTKVTLHTGPEEREASLKSLDQFLLCDLRCHP